jgi:2-keto-myo-inositol isomerase
MIQRREIIKGIGAAAGLALLPATGISGTGNPASNFRYCLNTSTISGKKPGLEKYIEITARAGYDGVELWVRDVQEYLKGGKSLNTLRRLVNDSKVKVESAIGFAHWMVDDDERRKVGFQQMEQEMKIMAELGCARIAAPPAGVSGDTTLDLLKVGERYKQLIELGKKTGVMPQLEFWGGSKAFFHLGQTLMVAAAANDPDVRILPDVYHLFRGGSGFNGLKMLHGRMIEIFHMNDFVATIPREEQADKDRVYPGDGVAPLKQVVSDLKNMGGTKVLSLELFNPEYWNDDPLKVARTGLQKMKNMVR